MISEKQSARGGAIAGFLTRTEGRNFASEGLVLLGVLLAVAVSRLWGYLLFHTLAELFSVCIAVTYFVIAWHTRKINEHPSIAALGIAYLFIAVLDVFHTLSYAGMGIFKGYDYAANQIWVQARFLEAVSLLLFSFILRVEGRVIAGLFGVLILYTLAGLGSIFVFRVFPVCYVQGFGQTQFKIGAEILIMLILAVASLSFRSRQASYPVKVFLSL